VFQEVLPVELAAHSYVVSAVAADEPAGHECLEVVFVAAGTIMNHAGDRTTQPRVVAERPQAATKVIAKWPLIISSDTDQLL
jgi:hypothetical protein